MELIKFLNKDVKEIGLEILAGIYGFGAIIRRELYESDILPKKRLPKPVISVGNLNTGGTGKTPIVIYLSKKLQSLGFNVVVLSRGYKRKSRGTLIVSDGNNIFHSWEKVGDEPYLIALNKIPIVVSNSRYKAGLKALEKLKVDIFILDDGFQHFQLERDIDIVVVDGTRPFWEDNLLPLGTLREPEDIAANHADVFILNKIASLSLVEKERLKLHLEKYLKPVFLTKEKFEKLTNLEKEFPLDILKNKKIGVFSGLGNNEQFFQLLERLSHKYNFCIKGFKSLPDHYDYKNFKLPNINIDYWITTEKDLIKIPHNKRILALKYEIELDDEFIRLILDKANLH